ncbi:MAG: HD domain-containing protein [Clostridia bacterium]|nr:HD domain-containing protein [Clostridia bacterium]
MRLEDKKEIYKILSDNTISTYDNEYNEFVADILNNPVVTSMKEYIQHGNTTCYDHCVSVSYTSYKIAKYLKLDAKSTARAALLHDLFLYDWHKVMEKKPLFEKHGFTHPQTALDNAIKYFDLNDIEKDIIVKHMWPLTFRKVPKYRESLVVTFVDKYCSTNETFEPLTSKIAKSNFLSKKQYL